MSEGTPTPPPESPHQPLESELGAKLQGALGSRFAALQAGLERPLVFVDIEATGTDPVSDRIIELCLLRITPEAIEPERTWRIDPGVRIPIEATEVHGIRNEDLQGCPKFSEIAANAKALVDGADLAGFSAARFDVRILHAEFVRARVGIDLSSTRVIDTQILFHTREPRHLAAALQFYRGKELPDAHGARADTIATLEVLAGQLERYPDLPLDVQGLHEASSNQNDTHCDIARRLVWRDNEPVFNFGRLRGKSLRWVASDPTERKYLKWFLEGNFEDDAKSIIRDALQGRIRRRAGVDATG